MESIWNQWVQSWRLKEASEDGGMLKVQNWKFQCLQKRVLSHCGEDATGLMMFFKNGEINKTQFVKPFPNTASWFSMAKIQPSEPCFWTKVNEHYLAGTSLRTGGWLRRAEAFQSATVTFVTKKLIKEIKIFEALISAANESEFLNLVCIVSSVRSSNFDVERGS